MIVNMEKLKEKIDAGLVNFQKHSILPLNIYKYSQQCVFTGAWDEITLRCRGVVLDDEGNIVVNGFEKFFNHNEMAGLVEFEKRRDSMPYTVTEKMDGSLIQVALWNGELIVTSSGSFDSEQARKARHMIEAKGMKFEEGKTYLFEIIYPENRIVLDYGDKESLVLLAIMDTETGKEAVFDSGSCPLECVKEVHIGIPLILDELKRADYINKEGYIIRFEDGHRVKMKYAEYMRLHKIVAGVNEKFVWEALRDGVDLEQSLKGVPDELYDFVQKNTRALKTQFENFLARGVLAKNAIDPTATRKEQAAYVMQNYKDISALVFQLLDGKPTTPTIWKMLKPEKITVSFGKGEI